jgi:hypothetical protein
VYGVIVNDTFLLCKIYNSLLILQFRQLKEVILDMKKTFVSKRKMAFVLFVGVILGGI